MRDYPYGDAFDAKACIGADFNGNPMFEPGTDYPREVGSTASCQGGYPGLLDMSGNIWEWEDSCNGSNGNGDVCLTRGGSYVEAAGDLSCTHDIAPTREMYRGTGEAFARAYWHWFFLIQPAPFPERMIGADPDAYWLKKCGSGSAGLRPFDPRALDEYLRCFRDPAVIHASCEDYRAAASIDIAHDDADGALKLAMPLLALWGEQGTVHACFDVPALWRERAADVRGRPLPGGHYLAEELPGDVAEELVAFFS